METTWLVIVLSIAGWLSVLVTLLATFRSPRWWIRIWDFPRPQVAVICLGVLVPMLFVAPLSSPWALVTIAAVTAAFVYQITRVWPYTPFARRQAASVGRAQLTNADQPSVRILVSNVLQQNRDAGPLRDVIERVDPDIVLVVETDDWWRDQLAPVSRTRPHVVGRALDNTYGMLLFSRLELDEIRVRELTRSGIPSIRARVRLGSQRTFTFYGVHPPPPFPTFSESSTPRDAELVVVAREIAGRSGPVVVAGDLNDVAWSDMTTLFQRLSGLLDPRRGRGLFNTFHARYPFARWPLDHVFFSKEFAVADVRRMDDIGSDHFPILIELALIPAVVERHDAPPRPTPDGREQADAILNDENHENHDPALRSTAGASVEYAVSSAV